MNILTSSMPVRLVITCNIITPIEHCYNDKLKPAASKHQEMLHLEAVSLVDQEPLSLSGEVHLLCVLEKDIETKFVVNTCTSWLKSVLL